MKKNINTLTPGIFWYWNDNPTPTKIRRQLKTMKDAGYRTVYLHPMPETYHKFDFFAGMKTPYLGKRYFEYARMMLDECRKLGLVMMPYDEGGWPSGGVVDTLVKKYPDDRVRALEKMPDGSIREIRIERPDLANPRVTDHFIEMTYEPYYRELGDAFGKDIIGIFTDEPFWECYLPKDAVGIPPGLEQELKRHFNVNFQDILPLLFQDAPDTDETRIARRQYVDACTALYARNYPGRLQAWCKKHNLQFEGHFLYEDLFFHCGFFNDFPRLMDNMDVPGVDTIFRMIYPKGGVGNFARFAQASAIRKHRQENLCECFNVYGYDITTEQMAFVANMLAVKGINRILTMPYLISDYGVRKICCATDFSPRNPYWRHVKSLNAYLEWLGQFDAGALDTDIRVLAVTEQFLEKNVEKHSESSSQYAENVDKMLAKLDDAMVFWRFTTPDEAASANVPRVLIVPGTFVSPDINAAIEQWRSKGVTIINGFGHTNFAQFACLKTQNATKDIHVLPCRRNEGDCIMLFNSSNKQQTLVISDGQKYREILPPDDSLARLTPVQNKADGTCTIELPPYTLRILQADANALPASEQFQAHHVELSWKIEKVERVSYTNHAPTCYRTIRDNRSLPENGDYSQLEPDFSGTLFLSAELESDHTCEGLLRLEQMWYGGTLLVNGRKAGERAFAPWLFPVHLKRGKNILKLKVNSTGGSEWRRCHREEQIPEGWVNSFEPILQSFTEFFPECGASRHAVLFIQK